MIECDENLMEKLADRAINLSSQDVSRLYGKWREEHMGSENGKALFERLDEYIKEYNLCHKEEGGCIMMKRYSAPHTESQAEISSDEEVIAPKRKKQKLQKHTKEKPLLVTICMPLMARVHQGIPQAGEMMFVDSTACIDRYNLSIYVSIIN